MRDDSFIKVMKKDKTIKDDGEIRVGSKISEQKDQAEEDHLRQKQKMKDPNGSKASGLDSGNSDDFPKSDDHFKVNTDDTDDYEHDEGEGEDEGENSSPNDTGRHSKRRNLKSDTQTTVDRTRLLLDEDDESYDEDDDKDYDEKEDLESDLDKWTNAEEEEEKKEEEEEDVDDGNDDDDNDDDADDVDDDDDDHDEDEVVDTKPKRKFRAHVTERDHDTSPDTDMHNSNERISEENILHSDRLGSKRSRRESPVISPSAKTAANGLKFPPGLKNLGYTCYFNAVIQILFYIRGFRTAVMDYVTAPSNNGTLLTPNLNNDPRGKMSPKESSQDDGTDVNIKSELPTTSMVSQISPENRTFIAALQSLFQEMETTNEYSVNPSNFLHALRSLDDSFPSYGQQDAQEFLRYFVDKIIHIFNGQAYKEQESFVVTSLFQGESVTSVRCLECDTVSISKEKFLDISLPVDSSNSLTWSLCEHCKEETLFGPDKYKCDFCATYTEARRWWSINQLPPFVTIHLKLFSYAGKVSAAIECPFTMNFSEWCTIKTSAENMNHILEAVIVHEGASSSSGHYYVYISSSLVHNWTEVESSTWYCFDDAEVTCLNLDEVKQKLSPQVKTRKTPYLLFYKRVD